MTTKRNTAKTAIACALASALTLGSFCAPALAAPAATDAIVAQSFDSMDEDEAVAQFDDLMGEDEAADADESDRLMSADEAINAARTRLGISADNVSCSDATPEQGWQGAPSFKVKIETKDTHVEHYAVIDARTGHVFSSWVEG